MNHTSTMVRKVAVAAVTVSRIGSVPRLIQAQRYRTFPGAAFRKNSFLSDRSVIDLMIRRRPSASAPVPVPTVSALLNCSSSRTHPSPNGIPFAFENRVTDRKSTRLNSSHSQISYAVFCLKKKNKENTQNPQTTNARNSILYLSAHRHLAHYLSFDGACPSDDLADRACLSSTLSAAVLLKP